MFTAQGPSVLHAIVVTVVQFAQVHLVIIIAIVACYPKKIENAFFTLGSGTKN